MKPDRSLQLGAEVGLAVLTLATVVGMHRLFAGDEWLVPLVAHAVAAHATVTVARRRGLSIPAVAALMTVAAGVLVAWVSYGSTTVAGLPTGETVATMREDVSSAWSLYQEVIAPVPVETGFIVASAFAIWAAAFVADWAAFRIWVPFEATLPAGTLFMFTALLGAERGRGWAIGLYAAASLAFFLLHRMARQDRSSHWVGDRRAQGHRWLVGVGLGIGATAVLLGTVVGPALPGADAVGVINPRGLGPGEGSRVTISPLVDIRSRLVQQSDVVAFEVRSPAPAYWRLTSLDRFDGSIWSSSGSYGQAKGDLPSSRPDDVPAADLEQTFTIAALSAIWLPSAFEPHAVSAEGFGVLYDDTSATLIVDRESDTSDGLTYQVTSTTPRLTAADLAGAAGDLPEEVRERFLQLPGTISPAVTDLARRLTATAPTPYEQALALQRHLRTFRYDLNVAPGHSDAVLEQFLFQTRRGYCEQFAGSFAAMARVIGLPARVAVGFTQGEQDPNDPSRFVVRGENAHAWPEVYLAGAGWVGFEPTPGRGQPFAEAYTGVPAAQAATANPGTATTAPPTTAPNPSATIPDAGSGPQPGADEVDTGTGTGSDEPASGPSFLERFVLDPLWRLAPFVIAFALVYALVVPLGEAARRARRRQRATSPSAVIEVAWAEAAEAAEVVGYREVASETPVERAGRLAEVLATEDAAEHSAQLARRLEVAFYSATGADRLDGELARESSAALVTIAREQSSTTARLWPWLDPRPWLRRAGRALRRPSQITTTVRADLEAERELVGSGDRR